METKAQDGSGEMKAWCLKFLRFKWNDIILLKGGLL